MLFSPSRLTYRTLRNRTRISSMAANLSGITLSSNFDSGNGKLISMREEGDKTVIDMEIVPDVYCKGEGKSHLQ